MSYITDPLPEDLADASIEQIMYHAVEQLRNHGIRTQFVVDKMVVDADVDGDGKWDTNPDNFAGDEPGNMTIKTFAPGVTPNAFNSIVTIAETKAKAIVGPLDKKNHDPIDYLVMVIETEHTNRLEELSE